MATSARSPLAVALLLATACDRLSPDPGADFAVTATGPSPLVVVGELLAPVRFEVSGCDAFDTAIKNGGVSRTVAAARAADGTWAADVPAEWLRVEDHDCLHDALRPLDARVELVVTCRDGARTAVAPIDVSYATATRAYASSVAAPMAGVRYLFPASDPLHPFAMYVSWAQDGVSVFSPAGAEYFPFFTGLENGGVDAESAPLGEPRLVANPRDWWAFSKGCASIIGCPDFSVDEARTVPSEQLAWMTEGGIAWSTFVPERVLDLAMLDDRRVLVLSQQFPFWRPTTTLSLVTDPEGTAPPYVTVLGHYPGEWVQSRFSTLPDGRLAWLAWMLPDSPEIETPIRAVVRVTDGASVEARWDPTGAANLGYVVGGLMSIRHFGELSPDGAQIVLSGATLVGADGVATPLEASKDFGIDGKSGDAVWLTDAVALWRGTDWLLGTGGAGFVDVFDRAPPHRRRFAHEVGPTPGSSGQPDLLGVVAVGDKLVLTTATGIRVLGPDGALVGGADPLPCGLTTTSRAARVGPTTAAVGAGPYWYVFDLAGP